MVNDYSQLIMQRISVSEFKARCLKLFAEVKLTGRSILVTKNGQPIALVSPPPPEKATRSGFGAMADRTEILGDIIEPLGTDDWEVFHD